MRKFLIFIIVFFTFNFLFSEINMNLIGAGARAAGMGGAFIGVSDDATSASWNPAGLAQLEKPEFSIVGKLTSEEMNYQNTEYNIKNKTYLSHFKLNFISFVKPLTSSNVHIVPSFSAQNQLNFENRVKDNEYNFETYGSANTLNLGIGIGMKSGFSFGFVLNKWIGQYTINDYNVNNTTTLDVSGFNIGSGLLMDFGKTESKIPIKLGLSYKKPFDLVLENGDLKYTISMPPMIGFGTSFRIGQNFTFAFDYEIRAFKDRKQILRFKDPNNQDNNRDDLFYYNLNQIRFGAEYLLVTDFAVLPLRVGIFNEPTTNYLKNEDDSPKEQIVGSGFSLGTGLIFSRFSFDIAAIYSGWDKKINAYELSRYRGSVISSLIFYF